MKEASKMMPLTLASRPITDGFFLFLFIFCSLLPQILLAGLTITRWAAGGSLFEDAGDAGEESKKRDIRQVAAAWSEWIGFPIEILQEQVITAIVTAALASFAFLHCLRVLPMRTVVYTAIFGSMLIFAGLGLAACFGGLTLLEDTQSGSWFARRFGEILLGVSAVEAVFIAFFWDQIWIAVAVLRSTQELLRDAGAASIACSVFFGAVHLCGMLLWGLAALGAWSLLQAEEGLGQALREKYAFESLIMLVLCYFWGNCFVMALSSFVAAAIATEWYYTTPYDKKSSVISASHVAELLKVGLLRHGGSLALGALLLAMVRTLNFFLFWAGRVQDSTEGENQQSQVRRTIRRAREAAGRCLESMARFASKQAYVEIAISGCGFLSGAGRAAKRAARVPKRFMAVEAAGYLQRGACELLLVVITGLGSTMVSLVRHGDYEVKSIGVSCVVAWLIAESLLHPVSLSTTAILHCLCIDELKVNPAYTPKPLQVVVEHGSADMSFASHYRGV